MISFLLFFIGVSGCSNVPSNKPPIHGYPGITEKQQVYPGQPSRKENNINPDEIIPPNPKPGSASISGVLYGYRYVINEKVLLSGAVIYLTRATGEKRDEVPPILVGALPEKGDILSRTDSNGVLMVNNIPPGNYFLIFSIDLSPIIQSKDDLKPRLIQLSANQKLNLGELVVPIR
jgi:hypothetical protein